MNGTKSKNYDGDFCGSLPLHIINLVQPYGVLIVLDKAGLNIVQASENVFELLSTPTEDAVGSSFGDFIPQPQFIQFKELLQRGAGSRLPLNFTINGGSHQALVHVKNEYILLEIDKVPRSNQSSFIDVFQTLNVTNLGDVYEPAQTYSNVASGMIAIPIDAVKGEFIIGFRPEVVQEVNWGGNPNEAINFEKDNMTYHPRNSFRLWQQVVKNTSLPWLPGEIMAAEDFKNFAWNTGKRNT